MDAVIQIKKFSELDLSDDFFDSLKEAYSEFSDWFARKANESAYVVFGSGEDIQGFLYLKVERGPIADINPPLNVPQCLKVGTFKIDAHGTKLGERFVKLIVDTALSFDLRHAYVTVFQEHRGLINILEKFGFFKHGEKKTPNGTEDVYVKDMTRYHGDVLLDYPCVDSRGRDKWLLGIYPEFHTQLFPDSILKTESPSVVQDVSHTNSIHKVYVGMAFDMPKIKDGSCVVVYRCQRKNGSEIPWFKSVATSLCVVETVRPKKSFAGEEEFIRYCQRHSVFTREDLSRMYRMARGSGAHAIKMTYNLAFQRRPNLKAMVEGGVVPHPSTGAYLGLLQLTDEQFQTVLGLGGVDGRFVIY